MKVIEAIQEKAFGAFISYIPAFPLTRFYLSNYLEPRPSSMERRGSLFCLFYPFSSTPISELGLTTSAICNSRLPYRAI